MPLTRSTQTLLKFNNRPLIENLLLKAKNEGFENVIISLNYLGNKIKSKLKDGKKFGLKLKILRKKF